MKATLIILAALLGAAIAADQCLDSSVSVYSVNQLDSISGLAEDAYTANTPAEVAAVFQSLLNALGGVATRYYENAYIATENDNFYGYFSCRYYYDEALCDSESDKYFTVRNDAVYSTTFVGFRRNFASANGPTGTGASTMSSALYPTTARPWYVAAEEKARAFFYDYSFFESNNLGRSYVDSTNFGAQGFVMAADKRSDEPCDHCIQRLEAVPAVWEVAGNFGSRKFLTTAAGNTRRSYAASYILTRLQATLYDVESLYLGLDSDEFHQVVDCSRTNGYLMPPCGETHARYVYGVVDGGTAESRLTFYAIDKDDEVDFSSAIYTSDPYFCTGRPWYLWQNGWSDEYTYADANGNVGRTFAMSIDGGVAGADPTVKAIKRSCSPASAVLASLSLVLVAMAAALF